MFLLDTDHLGILQWQSQPEYGRLLHRMAPYPPAAFFVSVVSLHEQTLGANAYINQARKATALLDGYRLFQKILAAYCAAQVLPFDQGALNHFDSLRSHRVRIGTMDLRIAAIAHSCNLIVLTRNLSDFQQVPGLTVQNWTV